MGLTAASSTRAVWARNFGLAFMALLSRIDRRGAKGPAVQRFPAAALSASGSKGLLSPGQESSPGQDPYVAPRDLTPNGGGLASASAARTYCECEPYAVTLALAAVARVRGKRSN